MGKKQSPEKNKRDDNKNNFKDWIPVIVAIITTIGTILAAYFQIIKNSSQPPNILSLPTSTLNVTQITPTITITPQSCPNGMKQVQAGYFYLGTANPNQYATAEDIKDETPQHRIYLDDYCIDRTEVGNQAYEEFIKDQNPSQPLPPVSDYGLPVVSVTWDEADNYCRWRGQKLGVSLWLPTEYQWEKAARGIDKRIFPWGNIWEEEIVNADKSQPLLLPVDSLPLGASPYGVLNMAGNVAEWTQDWYYDDWYLKALKDDDLNPARPSTPSGKKVVRGGSVASPPKNVRVSDRVGVYSPEMKRNSIGFRCATILP